MKISTHYVYLFTHSTHTIQYLYKIFKITIVLVFAKITTLNSLDSIQGNPSKNENKLLCRILLLDFVFVLLY